MGSGAIYAVIIVVWAIVLVPLFLRRHDRARTQEALSRKVSHRVVARRAHTRELSARAEAVRAARAARRPKEPEPEPDPIEDFLIAARANAQKAARRRRRVLGFLVLVSIGLGIAAGLSRLPVWSAAIPAGLFLLMLLIGTRQAARARRRTRGRIHQIAAANPQSVARRRAAIIAAALAHGADGVDEADESTADSGLVANRVPGGIPGQSVAVDPGGTPAGAPWAAVPATLPTYVTAPAARGDWSAATMLERVDARRRPDAEFEPGAPVEAEEMTGPIPVVMPGPTAPLEPPVEQELPERRVANG